MMDAYKGLDEHIKEQFAALQKILEDTRINVSGFDPDSEDDIKWLSGEIDKILKAAPEIKVLEDKLKTVDDVHPALDKVIADLQKITDVQQMIPSKEDVAGASPVQANGSASNSTTNVTSDGASATVDSSAPTAGGAASSDSASDPATGGDEAAVTPPAGGDGEGATS
jgi:hypothetical protein